MFRKPKPDQKKSSPPTSAREEQLKLEHATLMEQYKAARAEIDGLLDASRQVVNLSLTVITLVFGGLAFFQFSLPEVFLVLPFFLYGLVWMQLRQILLMRRASAYISNSLAPRVRDILQEISPTTPLDRQGILDWEEHWKSPGQRKGKLFLLPVLGSGYGLPLFAAVLLVVFYYLSVPQLSMMGWVLVALNALALIYSLILGYMVEFRRFGQEYSH